MSKILKNKLISDMGAGFNPPLRETGVTAAQLSSEITELGFKVGKAGFHKEAIKLFAIANELDGVAIDCKEGLNDNT